MVGIAVHTPGRFPLHSGLCRGAAAPVSAIVQGANPLHAHACLRWPGCKKVLQAARRQMARGMRAEALARQVGLVARKCGRQITSRAAQSGRALFEIRLAFRFHSTVLFSVCCRDGIAVNPNPLVIIWTFTLVSPEYHLTHVCTQTRRCDAVQRLTSRNAHACRTGLATVFSREPGSNLYRSTSALPIFLGIFPCGVG